MDIRLYQLADSALPTGGFVFSSGMESAYTMGWLNNLTHLQEYLIGALHSFSHNELRFVQLFYNELNEKSEISKLSLKWYHASLTSLGMRKGSLLQGESWNRIIQKIYPRSSEKSSFFESHFIPTFCQTLFQLGHSVDTAIQLLFFVFVRDQVSASVRLGVCGPMEAQLLQSELLKNEDKVKAASDLKNGQPQKTAARWEVCQAMHSRVYSTLFQN